MTADQFKEIAGREPFRAFEIVTAAGERYQIFGQRDYLYRAERPDLLVFFGEGIYRIVDVTQLTSAAVL
jgi:hypothetical protein